MSWAISLLDLPKPGKPPPRSRMHSARQVQRRPQTPHGCASPLKAKGSYRQLYRALVAQAIDQAVMKPFSRAARYAGGKSWANLRVLWLLLREYIAFDWASASSAKMACPSAIRRGLGNAPLRQCTAVALNSRRRTLLDGSKRVALRTRRHADLFLCLDIDRPACRGGNHESVP